MLASITPTIIQIIFKKSLPRGWQIQYIFLCNSNHSQLTPTHILHTQTETHTYSRHTFGQVAASSHKGSHYWVPQRVLMGIFLNTTSIGLLPYTNEVLTGPHTFLDLINGRSIHWPLAWRGRLSGSCSQSFQTWSYKYREKIYHKSRSKSQETWININFAAYYTF